MKKLTAQMIPHPPEISQLEDEVKVLLKGFAADEPNSAALVEAFYPEEKEPTSFQEEDAKLIVAKQYSFSSWGKMIDFVKSYGSKEVSPAAKALKEAIDANDLKEVQALIESDSELINEHLQRGERYGNRRALTYACQQCRVEIAEFLIASGSDIHEDGNLAAARGSWDIPILELLLKHGLDVNCKVYDWGPLLLYPCELLNADSLRWLLEHGADPTLTYPGQLSVETPMTMVLGTYGRSTEMAECINLLVEHGVAVEDNPVMDIHRDRLDSLKQRLDTDKELVASRVHDVDYGQSGMRMMSAEGGTLLHVAAEWGKLDAVRLLFEAGADVNSRAEMNEHGVGGQTPLFHAVSLFQNFGHEVAELLLKHGADTGIRTNVLGSEISGKIETFEGTALEFAQKYPGSYCNDIARTEALFKQCS